jgi:hypothetical protein
MKRRKIYYVPGMISLICLPILCILYLNENKNVLRSVEVNYANKFNPNNQDLLKFDTTALSEPGNKRKYKEFMINEFNDDSTSILNVEKTVNQLIEKADTINGIHIVFGDNIKYRNYISIIDIFNKYNRAISTTDENNAFRNHKKIYSPTYLLFENQMWFYIYKYPKLEKERWECRIQCVFRPYKPTFKEEFLNLIDNNKVLLKLWPFFLIFIILSIISIRSIRNNYIKNK